MECNGDLIDARIFQNREAPMARYRYLLALARQQGVNQPLSESIPALSHACGKGWVNWRILNGWYLDLP